MGQAVAQVGVKLFYENCWWDFFEDFPFLLLCLDWRVGWCQGTDQLELFCWEWREGRQWMCWRWWWLALGAAAQCDGHWQPGEDGIPEGNSPCRAPSRPQLHLLAG